MKIVGVAEGNWAFCSSAGFVTVSEVSLTQPMVGAAGLKLQAEPSFHMAFSF